MLFSAKFAGLLGFLALLPSATFAAPVGKRADDKAAATDLLVLQFALVLENLEADFYKQGLEAFPDAKLEKAGFLNGAAATETISTIQGDEAAHVTLLAGAVKASGKKAIADSCKFDFSAALKDVPTFLATARTLEVTGLAAYLGAASLVTDKSILQTAGSILTVEGRHQTNLNLLSGATSIPNAFDLAMTPPQVLSVASGFIKGCDLGIKPNAPLSIASDKPGEALIAMTKVNLSAAGSEKQEKLFCQMLVGGQAKALVQPASNCLVPTKVNGPVFAYLTNTDEALDVNVATQKPDNIVAGPAVVFVDSVSDKLSKLVLKGGSSSRGSSESSSEVDMSSMRGGGGVGNDGTKPSGLTVGIGAEVDGFSTVPTKKAKSGSMPLSESGMSMSSKSSERTGGNGLGKSGKKTMVEGQKIGVGCSVKGFSQVSADMAKMDRENMMMDMGGSEKKSGMSESGSMSEGMSMKQHENMNMNEGSSSESSSEEPSNSESSNSESSNSESSNSESSNSESSNSESSNSESSNSDSSNSEESSSYESSPSESSSEESNVEPSSANDRRSRVYGSWRN